MAVNHGVGGSNPSTSEQGENKMRISKEYIEKMKQMIRDSGIVVEFSKAGNPQSRRSCFDDGITDYFADIRIFDKNQPVRCIMVKNRDGSSCQI